MLTALLGERRVADSWVVGLLTLEGRFEGRVGIEVLALGRLEGQVSYGIGGRMWVLGLLVAGLEANSREPLNYLVSAYQPQIF